MKLLAENINRTVDDDIYKSFYLEIGNKLFDTIKSSRLTADSRMNMFTIFHNNSLQDHGRKLWIDLLENTEFPTNVCNMLYQYILGRFLKYALNYRNKQFEKEEVTINCESTKLDKSEEQTRNLRVESWNKYFQCGVPKGNFQNIIQRVCLIIQMPRWRK